MHTLYYNSICNKFKLKLKFIIENLTPKKGVQIVLKIVLPLIVSVVLSLTSISFSQDTISSKYFPLNIGNTWIYSVQSFPPFDEYKIYRIERDTTITDHKYFLYSTHGNSEWIRYDSLTGNLLSYSSTGSCSNYSNDKIVDSLSSGVGDIINCQIHAIFSRECTQIYTETIFNSFQKQVKEFEHDGFVLQYLRYAQDFGIIFKAAGEPPPVSYYEILKGCVINGIVYGDTTLTSVRQISSTVPNNFSLSQNYPNPFNPTTIINYSIPTTQYTILRVYNSLGKEVSTLVNENQSPGSYSVDFNGEGLPSGIYFYKLEAGDFVDTKRMILLK